MLNSRKEKKWVHFRPVLEGSISSINSVLGIPIWPERSIKRQQAEVKSLDHVFIPAEAHLNDKKDIVNKDQQGG